ncbi:MAG: alpha/beta fold hydrolase [Calditrichaeota bacterium]|nr:alpha/beta fold hydrolase [Calditrichota bacterium]
MPYFDLGNFKLYYELRGKGEPVIFSHSLVCDLDMFEAQAKALSDTFLTVNVDTRGHGRSGLAPNENWTLEDMAEDFVPLLNHLKLGKVHWVGLSMGGMLGLRLALAHPDRVASLVLMDTSGQAEPPQMHGMYIQMANLVRAGQIDKIMDNLLGLFFSSSTRENQPELVTRWQEKFLHIPVEGVYRAALAVFNRTDLSNRLKDISVPTLVVRGEEDMARLPAESDFLVHSIPNARLEVIPRAAHLSALEQPETATKLIRDFIGSI